MIENFDLDKLIDWVGVKGTRAALLGSDILTFEGLKEIAEKNSVKIPPKVTKKEIIERLLIKYDRRINLSLEELEKMSSEEILDYLADSKATEVEIIELLHTANIPTKKIKSKKKLIEFAADSISGIGLYKRISSSK